MSVVKRQDMPPKGGYAPIVFKRIPARSFFNGYTLIAGYLGMTAASLCLYGYTYYVRNKENIEMRSAMFAIQPLIQAERDRALLKQMGRNRDAEAELMKNVKNWEVGTLYGERIYKTLPEDTVWYPTDSEFYAHASHASWVKRFFAHHKT